MTPASAKSPQAIKDDTLLRHRHRSRRIAGALLALSLPLFAQALPREASVPGGVALIRLAPVDAHGKRPQAWFGEQAVMVVADQGEWVAVLGLPLDQPSGTHELRLNDGQSESHRRFEVRDKRYAEQRITLKNTSKVMLSPEDEARAVGEIARIGELKKTWRATDDTDTEFQVPAAGRLSGRFGLRRFFNGEARAPHVGLDIAVGRGTPVRAVAPGKVLAVDDYFFNGKTVFIDHGNGLLTMYCHLDRIDVQPGEVMTKGDPMGASGMSGRASGPHLHWSVVLNGVMVDPELFIKTTAARGR